MGVGVGVCRGTSLIRNCAPLVPYSRAVPRALWWSQVGGGAVSYERGTKTVQKRFGELAEPTIEITIEGKVSSCFMNNYFAEKSSGSEEGSYLRLIDVCVTQL